MNWLRRLMMFFCMDYQQIIEAVDVDNKHLGYRTAFYCGKCKRVKEMSPMRVKP